jgi:hypothetical protein
MVKERRKIDVTVLYVVLQKCIADLFFVKFGVRKTIKMILMYCNVTSCTSAVCCFNGF